MSVFQAQQIAGQIFTFSEGGSVTFSHLMHAMPAPPPRREPGLSQPPQGTAIQRPRIFLVAHLSSHSSLPFHPYLSPSESCTFFLVDASRIPQLPPLSLPPPMARPLSFCLNPCFPIAVTHCHSPVHSEYCSLIGF